MKILDAAGYLVYLSYYEKQYSLTPLKLQKLLYYAQGWSYVWDDKPLFKEHFEPWKYGPVNQSVYDHFKKYHSDEIPENESLVPDIKRDDLETLSSIWKLYGKLSANKLVKMTHDEDPWVEAYYSDSNVIDNEAIKRFFKNKY